MFEFLGNAVLLLIVALVGGVLVFIVIVLLVLINHKLGRVNDLLEYLAQTKNSATTANTATDAVPSPGEDDGPPPPTFRLLG